MLTASALGLNDVINDSGLNNIPALCRQSQSPYFFTLNDKCSLRDVLDAPYHLLLEIGKLKELNITLAYFLSECPDFGLCVNTQTAYNHNIAHIIAQSLNTRFGLMDHKSMNIATCLQEAILNAVVHGNLSIDSNFHSIDEMEAHYAHISQRLEQEAYKHLRITVCAWDFTQYLKISVTDQGKGFDMKKDTVSENSRPYGRGLQLIQTMADKVWLDEDTKTLNMTFSY